jgi:hypothetical protein
MKFSPERGFSESDAEFLAVKKGVFKRGEKRLPVPAIEEPVSPAKTGEARVGRKRRINAGAGYLPEPARAGVLESSRENVGSRKYVQVTEEVGTMDGKTGKQKGKGIKYKSKEIPRETIRDMATM